MERKRGREEERKRGREEERKKGREGGCKSKVEVKRRGEEESRRLGEERRIDNSWRSLFRKSLFSKISFKLNSKIFGQNR